MSIEHVTGDLFTVKADALAHGVNMRGVMGAGIAKQFADRIPSMEVAYRGHCIAGNAKLGSFFKWTDDTFEVYNLFTQDQPGPNARYAAVEVAVLNMLWHAEDFGIESIAIPRIGCGIGGLQWRMVQLILDEVTYRHPVKLIVCSLDANAS